MGLQDELQAHEGALRSTVTARSGEIERLVDEVTRCYAAGGKVLVCGNGGSAADSQHLAAEFMNRLRRDRAPLPALALTTDTSVLTCVANDSCFSDVFARQVEALGRQGDILLALSTSGRSENVLVALVAARRLGLMTVGLTGGDGADGMGALCDLVIDVASKDCARIQECHEFIGHYLAGEVEARLFPVGGGTCAE